MFRIKNAEQISNKAEKLGITFSQSHPPYRPFKGSRFGSTEEQERFDELTHRAIINPGNKDAVAEVLKPTDGYVCDIYIKGKIKRLTDKKLITPYHMAGKNQ